MSTVTRSRDRSVVNDLIFPENYPDPRRIQNSDFLRQALGGISPSTFWKYRADGRIPAPDVQMGLRGGWFETTIAETVKTFTNRGAE